MSETTNKFGNSLTLPRDSIFHSVSKGTHSASHSGISGKGGRRHLIKAHLNRAFHHKSPTTGSQLTSSDVDEVSEPSFQSLEDFESISPGSRANNEEGGRLPRPRSLFSSLAGSIDDAPGAASTLISSSSSGNDEADAISASAKRHHRLHGLGKRKSLYASSLPINDSQWRVDLHIFNAIGLVHPTSQSAINAYVKISQNGRTLGKTAKSASGQPVWDQDLALSLTGIDAPLFLSLHVAYKKGIHHSCIGAARLALTECLPEITYQKHLDLMSSSSEDRGVGRLRVRIRLQEILCASPMSNRSPIHESRHRHPPALRIRKPRNSIIRTSQSLQNLLAISPAETSSLQHGPLASGVKIFEARYLGILRLQKVARPTNVYAKRWRVFEHQPAEVSIMTNPMTKATEIVSPRLPWPPYFLQGASSIDFSSPSGPQVIQFDSGILYLTVLSVCGLQSIPLSRFVNKVRASERASDSVHSGVVVAKMISYSQTLVRNAERLSTYVQLQLGKEKFVTKVQKFTYDPLWNQTFTFNLTKRSGTLVEIQLFNQANPSISGPASGIENIGDTLIDISQLPMDLTQRIEIELNGNNPKPRLLLLATLTGLTPSESPTNSIITANNYLLPPSANIPAIRLTSTNSTQRSDAESTIDSPILRPLRRSMESAVSPFGTPEAASPQTFHSESDIVTTIGNKGHSHIFSRKAHSHPREIESSLVEHYGWRRSLKDRFDVGYLRVKVIEAAGLIAKDLNGKSDPYCVLELVNFRAQTQTIRKNLNPTWNKTFIFPVTDIHSVLYVTVLDEDKTKSDFLGRVAIPLLKIRNNERSWYALKDAFLKSRSKGSILLEFFFVYNHKLSAGYKNQLRDNSLRLKVLFKPLGMVTQAFDDLCSWENTMHSLIALIGFNLAVWNFQPYMVPLGMLVGIIVNRYAGRPTYKLDIFRSARAACGVGASNLISSLNPTERILGSYPHDSCDECSPEVAPQSVLDQNDNLVINNQLMNTLETESLAPVETAEEQKEPKQGKNKFAAVWDILDDLPSIIDTIASTFERITGVFYWKVPWITWFSVVFLIIFTLILYFVPFRVVICIIGTNRLTKRILRPYSRSTIEVFNVISRVPSKPEAEQQRRLAPQAFADPR